MQQCRWERLFASMPSATDRRWPAHRHPSREPSRRAVWARLMKGFHGREPAARRRGLLPVAQATPGRDGLPFGQNVGVA
jgi:hypothetical protein